MLLLLKKRPANKRRRFPFGGFFFSTSPASPYGANSSPSSTISDTLLPRTTDRAEFLAQCLQLCVPSPPPSQASRVFFFFYYFFFFQLGFCFLFALTSLPGDAIHFLDPHVFLLGIYLLFFTECCNRLLFLLPSPSPPVSKKRLSS